MLNWDSSLVVDYDIEQQFLYVRNIRKAELFATDWTQVADAPVNKAAWATYRQQLRDLPTQNADPKKIVFPTRPA